MESSINMLNNLFGVIEKGLINFKNCGKDRLTVEYIETRQELLEKDWDSVKNINANLYRDFKLEDIVQAKVDALYEATEDTYINYKSLMKTTINKIIVKKQSEKTLSTESKSTKSYQSVKLPKIAIPKFSGKYSEWTTFHDLFVSLVHNNDSLDNVQKLHYLKGLLCDEAEQLIRHIPISDANYNVCWSKLDERYSNKRYLINCILKRLLGQKQRQVESAESLKELIDTTCDCLNALSNLKINKWDATIIYIISDKLDKETKKQWELTVANDSSNDLPSFEKFKLFIENRFRALECVEPRKGFQVNSHSSQPHIKRAMIATGSSSTKCEFCSESHKLCFCKAFAKQTIDSRRQFVSQNRICFNCLGSNHSVYQCNKPTTCRVCQKRHHSLLHFNKESESKGQPPSATVSTDSASSSTNTDRIVSCLSTGKVPKPGQVLLATALVNAVSKTGEYTSVRALLDQGSQACFVTEATAQFLKLKKIPIRGLISGLGSNSSTMAKHMVQISIRSRVDSNFNLNVNAYVLKKITSYLPERSIDTNLDWIDITDYQLADPGFSTPNRIDILLGAEAYSSIIAPGLMKSPSGTMIAQNTALGWVLSGAISADNHKKTITIKTLHAHIIEDELLRRFWEIEEINSTKKILTPEEKSCEELYSRTTVRDTTGRYIVKLPFRDEDPPCKAGNSRFIAEKRFKSLEKRLNNNPDLKLKYNAVIEEYLNLGHMRPIKKDDLHKNIAVYLPHHAVLRDDKTTTKVRVVFNASEKNSNGISLNDTLMIGPTLQSDLRHTVLRWRVYPIALVADIIKMYRQVRITEGDAIYQRILWRDSPEKEIGDYELVTITFGTASAPFQAVRTLHQVAYDEGANYPLAAEKVLKNYYMDDFMSGVFSFEEGIEIYRQMTELLSKGGFQLQKWNSNNPEIVEHIRMIEQRNNKREQEEQPDTRTNTNKDNLYTQQIKDRNYENNEIQYTQDKELEIKVDSTIKILGLTWNRSEDEFQYSVTLPLSTTAPVTKRSIISEIARLFDPLGWLAPSIIMAKVFIQKLWLAGVSWDEVLNNELTSEWSTYRQELFLLTSVRIPRWLGTGSNDDLELHGFSDASKTAYSAVVYVRSIDHEGHVQVSLLCAKTRVAPVKQISVPRLELCGAGLLSQLLIETADVLNISKDKIIAWTDSTVVLAWINSHPSRWKTFVANRTSEILTNMKATQWFHISTKKNPADCASRGLLPSLLINHEMWFYGPPFLKEKTIMYSRSNNYSVDLEQAVKVHVAVTINCSIFEQYSTLTKLIRIIAYCRRFLQQNNQFHKKYLHRIELDGALECCIRLTQMEEFTVEYKQLQDKGYLQLKSSTLKSLSPYLDDKGIIRIRGRLEEAQLSDQTKHPIVLPHSSHLTRLIVGDAHIKTLHGGPQLTTNYIRTAYWIIGARSLVKLHVRQCVTCAKQRASIKHQMMGSLPAVRCTPARPFLHSGVDYAGPINIRTSKGRGHHSYKGYICLFVCMATRAVHLEVVSDMSTQGFMAAFRRFVSRRGHCAKLHSDNGTTFVGASKELKQLTDIQASIAEHLEAKGTEWHFIPPHSPNFGGLWEAGVKSTKHHLKRVIGNSTLTYEELTTLLYQVEACLNSRPMSIIDSTDPGEPLPLTPGHFLIGEPLVNIPDQNYDNLNVNYLTRWQLIQRMTQSFWKRWSCEYLSTLMNRYKWASQVPEPELGSIVLIKEDDLPPSRWLLGRVVEKHPGDDGITRVVTVRTQSSVFKRPTSKLCILPVCT